MPATFEDRIQGLTTSVAVKAPCRVATSGNIVLYGLQTIDGVALEEGTRVLVRAQTNAVDNGIYCASASYWARAADFDGNRDVVVGTQVYVYGGTTGIGHYIVSSDDNPVDVGESSITISLSFALGDNAPVVTTTNALRALDTGLFQAAYLVGDHHAEMFVWDATVPEATHDADTLGTVFIAPDADEDGAWVNPLADSRLGTWANSTPPARFGRYRSGIKIAEAADADGATGSTDTWLDDVGIAETWAYLEQARLIVLDTNRQIGATFGVRSTGSSADNPIALVAVAHVGSTVSTGAHAAYFEAVAAAGSIGAVQGLEINAVNDRGAESGDVLPYGSSVGGVMALNLAAGGDNAVHGNTDDISAFIRLGKNGAEARAGIVFKTTALVRAGATTTGYAEALRLAQGHGFSWYGSEDEAESLRVYSTVSEATFAQSLSFRDTGMLYSGNLTGSDMQFEVEYVAGADNHLKLSPATAGNPVDIAAAGSDAAIDVRVIPKGAGTIDLDVAVQGSGTFTADARVVVKIGGVTHYLLASTT